VATETTEAGSQEETTKQENFFLLMDSQWKPKEGQLTPDLESIVGVWPLDDEGNVGRFRSNPYYEPIDENSPTDPFDAGLRLLVDNRIEGPQLQLLLLDILFDVAMNGDGRPLIAKSPDDVACMVIATSERHRTRVASPDWQRMSIEQLVEVIPDDVQLLFNPGGPAMVRLSAEFATSALELTPDEVEKAHDSFRNADDGVHVLPWEVSETDGDKAAEDGGKPA
jgi:hypothetical protein